MNKICNTDMINRIKPSFDQSAIGITVKSYLLCKSSGFSTKTFFRHCCTLNCVDLFAVFNAYICKPFTLYFRPWSHLKTAVGFH